MVNRFLQGICDLEVRIGREKISLALEDGLKIAKFACSEG